jgi:hypothetical protein
MRHMITGLFATHREVDLVVEHLVQEFGIPREQIQVHALDASDAAETRSPQDSDLDLSLSELGLPAEAVQPVLSAFAPEVTMRCGQRSRPMRPAGL